MVVESHGCVDSASYGSWRGSSGGEGSLGLIAALDLLLFVYGFFFLVSVPG